MNSLIGSLNAMWNRGFACGYRRGKAEAPGISKEQLDDAVEQAFKAGAAMQRAIDSEDVDPFKETRDSAWMN